MTHVRFGKVPKTLKKRLPFQRRAGGVELVARPGIKIDYGIAFHPDHGHRVFFNYADSPEFKNTWGPKSLRKWARQIETKLDEHRIMQAICFQQCDMAEDMNRRWQDAGCPVDGVAEPKGTMQ